MNTLETSRLDTKRRIERLGNRIDYLSQQIETLTTERTTLVDEFTLLTQLEEIYSKSNDTIDIGRAVVSKNLNGHRSMKQTIIDLLETGPATIKELSESTGYTKQQVGSTCHDLAQNGKIQKVARATYSRRYDNVDYSQ